MNSLNWLGGECKDRPLREKWLIASNFRVGNQWKEQVCKSGIPVINLHVKTPASIVNELSSPLRIAKKISLIGSEFSRILIRQILEEFHQESRFVYFTNLKSHDSFSQLMQRTVSELRLAGIDSNQFESVEIQNQAKQQDLLQILKRYEHLLKSYRVIDYAGSLAMLLDEVKSGAADTFLNPVIQNVGLLVSSNLNVHGIESQWLKSLGEKCASVSWQPVADQYDLQDSNVIFRRAVGEVNEVRTTIGSLIQNESRSFDQVEILHTDTESYVPLIHETLAANLPDEATIDELPVTFAEGISCIYSRPGRALRSWIRWMKNGFFQQQLVAMIREGLLEFESGSEGVGFSRLANSFRRIPIGMDRDRYLPRIRLAIEEAQAKQKLSKKVLERERASWDDFGLSVLQILYPSIEKLLANSRFGGFENAIELLESAQLFLQQSARTISKLDQFAALRLREAINSKIRSIQQLLTGGGMMQESSDEVFAELWQWLEELPVDLRILGSGPQPGKIHVDHFQNGGHSGRKDITILGLDDSRFPFRISQDPLLLDKERIQLSVALQNVKLQNVELPTVEQKQRELTTRTGQTLARISEAESICFSHSTYSLASDREQFPGSTLLEIFRHAHPDAKSAEQFEEACGPPQTFAELDTEAMSTHQQWWFKRTFQMAPEQRQEECETAFPHFANGRLAWEAQQSLSFGPFDGFVPDAGQFLDPVQNESRKVSPTQLEVYGKCPRRYFFRYGLKIQPPDELEIDLHRWLDPLVFGSAMHQIFETFLRKLTTEGKSPQFERDLELLNQIATDTISELSESHPVPNEDAYRRQVQLIRKSCEIFLREEERYCKEFDALPWVFEGSIGHSVEDDHEFHTVEPVRLTLADGRSFSLGGFIDRIDRVSSSFAIWDYKSGSDYGFDAGKPFQQGRKLQHYLYLRLLKHRMAALGETDIGDPQFGYFFPNPRMQGKRISWKSSELKAGDQIVSSLLESLGKGVFLATNDASDCTFCDYQSICGLPKDIADSSQEKLAAGHPELQLMKDLRESEGGRS